MPELSDNVDTVIEKYNRLFDQVYEAVGGEKAQGVKVVLKEEKSVREEWNLSSRHFTPKLTPLHTRVITGISSQPLMFSGSKYAQRLVAGNSQQICYPPIKPLEALKQGVVQIYVASFFEEMDRSWWAVYQKAVYKLLIEYVPSETEFTQRCILKKRRWKVSRGWRVSEYPSSVGNAVLKYCQEDFVPFDDFLRSSYHNHLAGNSSRFEQFLELVNSLESLLTEAERKLQK